MVFNDKKIIQSIIALNNYIIKNDFSGYEYDDLLASPFVNFLTFKSLWLKIIAVQIAKKSIINFRKILRVPKLKSTKAFGFFIKGYLYNYLLSKNKQNLEYAKNGLDWLLKNHSKGYSGICWGNDFSFASRAGIFTKGLPTIVWTSHIQEAFDLAYEVFKNEKYKNVVLSVTSFIENDLNRIVDNTGFCFAYAPGIMRPIHNSNLLGAIALLRGWKHSKNQKYYDLAEQSINWSVSRINSDGSWYYGDLPFLHWIDNYHTGYNLDCLSKSFEISNGKIIDFKHIIETYNFYKNNLFTDDCIPKFYHNKLYPIDIQAIAQAIESFSRYSVYDKDAMNFSYNILNWAIANMQKSNGSFMYRKYKYLSNKLEPIHWGQATMFSAINQFLYFRDLIH